MAENATQGFDEWAAGHLMIGHIGDKPAEVAAPTGPRPLHEIADDIRADWSAQGKGVSPYAMPYLAAMSQLESVDGMYAADSAASIVRYFLANATTWRGPKAREIKAELNKMIKGKY